MSVAQDAVMEMGAAWTGRRVEVLDDRPETNIKLVGTLHRVHTRPDYGGPVSTMLIEGQPITLSLSDFHAASFGREEYDPRSVTQLQLLGRDRCVRVALAGTMPAPEPSSTEPGEDVTRLREEVDGFLVYFATTMRGRDVQGRDTELPGWGEFGGRLGDLARTETGWTFAVGDARVEIPFEGLVTASCSSAGQVLEVWLDAREIRLDARKDDDNDDHENPW